MAEFAKKRHHYFRLFLWFPMFSEVFPKYFFLWISWGLVAHGPSYVYDAQASGIPWILRPWHAAPSAHAVHRAHAHRWNRTHLWSYMHKTSRRYV